MSTFPTRPVTIYDVAAAASVSPGTASKALNDQGKLSVLTRERVKRVADQLGFYPNGLAVSLARQRSAAVGLLCVSRFEKISSPIIEGIEEVMAEVDISVFLCNAHGNPERERRHLDALLSRRVDGIILLESDVHRREPIDLSTFQIPVVYAYTRVSSAGTVCVVPDDYEGGRLVGEHLANLGRRRVAFIGGPIEHEAVQARLTGAREAIVANKGELRAEHIRCGSWSTAFGEEAALELLNLRNDIDAIFCASDQLASGALHALGAAQIDVPSDIAVVGYDNWDTFALATRPTLTTVDMNLRKLGQLASRTLLRLLNGETIAETLVVSPSVVVRNSAPQPA